jgi:hypothetical protein
LVTFGALGGSAVASLAITLREACLRAAAWPSPLAVVSIAIIAQLTPAHSILATRPTFPSGNVQFTSTD